MYSLITRLNNKTEDSTAALAHLTKAQERLDKMSGFSHLRFIQQQNVPSNYIVLTFWVSRRAALASQNQVEALFEMV